MEALRQRKLRQLLDLGVDAVKVDFGESGPPNGVYASGRTGRCEHNLYPLRYNKAAADVTRAAKGYDLIWARSAWAGSQRYPLHWGGDSEVSDAAMAASLRGGLSFGLCGFSFWSHDIGGFSGPPRPDLYRRWMPFGMLTSHSRCHGVPPREPWPFGEAFEDDFRRAVELKYRLFPYVLAQAAISAREGWPMLRTLFFEYPEDPGAWFIEDQYLFGSDLLAAPLMEDAPSRRVYLPPGTWIDYQTGAVYEGGWHAIEAGAIPIVLLVRNGAALPHIALAPCAAELDWAHIELAVYAADAAPCRATVATPDAGEPRTVALARRGGEWVVTQDPFDGRITFTVRG